MGYAINIGLEVHLQLSTKSKVFCRCSTKFGSEPNSQACPVCLGLPGSLPVLNEEAFRYSIKAAIALNCKIAEVIKFDRKNYYYPDLPKNFQISQYDKPVAQNGILTIKTKGGLKDIRIKRVHLEEDAGKLFHKGGYSLVDYNRAGTPLLEIVSEPDLTSPDDTYEYLTSLKADLRYLGISDCNMEEGSLRCDANISLREESSEGLGVKTELKNMNSFKGVRNALEYEAKRQASLLEDEEKISQETRLWNEEKGVTLSMRGKEEAHDYRYFPEPDLMPFTVDKVMVNHIKEGLPELPMARQARFISEYKIPEYDASVLIQEKEIADFFEKAIKKHDNPKGVANWMMGDITAILNASNISITQTSLLPENLARMVKMVDSGAISVKIAKAILPDMVKSGGRPDELVEKKGLAQISSKGELEEIISKVMAENDESVSDYRSGKKNALTFLVGQVMKATRGKANPGMVNEILLSKLN